MKENSTDSYCAIMNLFRRIMEASPLSTIYVEKVTNIAI